VAASLDASEGEEVVNVLVVGGTGFLGGAITDAAIASGHEVTIFSRGIKPLRAPEAKVIVGDRHGDLSGLKGLQFDLVADTCAFAPDAIESLLNTLSPDIGRYALVSSISVYLDFSRADMDETAPATRATEEQLAFANHLTPEQRGNAESYDEAYGPLKREAELVALDKLAHRALILRAGLLVGAGDYTDRLTYWMRRIVEGGTVAAPGNPDRMVQLIDFRDAAAFIIAAASRGIGGIFNLTGKPLTFGSLLQTCKEVAGSSAKLEWIADDKIIAAGIEPWTQMPLWLPATDKHFAHFLNVNVAKAFDHGLATRSLEQTLSNILAWDGTRRSDPLKAGLPPQLETRLLSDN
jgi:2'-hydroxyisoflavone reductase